MISDEEKLNTILAGMTREELIGQLKWEKEECARLEACWDHAEEKVEKLTAQLEEVTTSRSKIMAGMDRLIDDIINLRKKLRESNR